jgi:hypothetical protein
MSMTQVAFAGLSPLRESIVRESLVRSGNFEVVEPWTSLKALRPQPGGDEPVEILFIELSGDRLPGALRAMLAAASRLSIIALSLDAKHGTVFELREHQTVMHECVADDLCAAICAAASHERAPAG